MQLLSCLLDYFSVMLEDDCSEAAILERSHVGGQVDNPSSAQPSNHTCQSARYVSKTILQPLARLLASCIPQCNLRHYHVKWNIYSAKSCPDSDAQNWEKY